MNKKSSLVTIANLSKEKIMYLLQDRKSVV